MAIILGLALAATGPDSWRLPGAMLAVWEGAWLIAQVMRGRDDE